MQSITLNISKNFGKSITIELPAGEKHIITHSVMPHLYSDLEKIIKNPPKRETTVHLPDDHEKPLHPMSGGYMYDFGDEYIPLENTEI